MPTVVSHGLGIASGPRSQEVDVIGEGSDLIGGPVADVRTGTHARVRTNDHTTIERNSDDCGPRVRWWAAPAGRGASKLHGPRRERDQSHALVPKTCLPNVLIQAVFTTMGLYPRIQRDESVALGDKVAII